MFKFVAKNKSSMRVFVHNIHRAGTLTTLKQMNDDFEHFVLIDSINILRKECSVFFKL